MSKTVKGLAFTGLVIAMFMGILDSTVVNIANRVQRERHDRQLGSHQLPVIVICISNYQRENC